MDCSQVEGLVAVLGAKVFGEPQLNQLTALGGLLPFATWHS